MAGKKFGGHAVLDRPGDEGKPQGVTDEAATSATDGGAADDGLQGPQSGTIFTSERRLYDPNELHNDWNSLRSWTRADKNIWTRRVTSPAGALVLVLLLVAAIVGVVAATGGIGARPTSDSGASSSGSAGMSNMPGGSGGSSSSGTSTTNVPAATQSFGNQPAKYVLDSDGAKHFTFTAEQVMWTPVKGGTPVLAWTLDGTVPGPMIRVTSGDHVRVTINNHFPEGTTIHFHGLQIPTDADGVPGVGQKPIPAGGTYTYDFTVPVTQFGTFFYHSHYDDLKQVPGGLYGAFIVDPKPGTPQASQVPAHDREYLQIISELGGYYVINGKSFPDTQVMTVTHGQNILVRVINLGELIHPMHLHGHTFSIVAEDANPLAQPIQKDTLTIAPGEAYDFTFNAWAAPGSVYPFHCHILAHVMNPGQSMDEMGGLITLIEYTK